ncbi:HAMP domain-containing protein [Mycobacterium spongiae]|uniref:HAMP domain-containing protein n=2 Tax=Mycobacterium spongiae TaxID=886343 RepID=A0A975JZI5_9MYCO|nr:adenylate/guanylate cyclase domain-containing protein [Mycobacterium spongiae]QUR68268.1 HAMP domain-containing protein [Mycobacterium spongiae]
MSIQSKLIVMLLMSSIVSAAVIAVVAFGTGRELSTVSSARWLTQLRTSQERAIQAEFENLTTSLVSYSSSTIVVAAAQLFTAGFDQLANATIDPEQQLALVDYYTNELIAPTERDTGVKLDIDAVLPSSSAPRYLQTHYTVAAAADGDAATTDDSPEGRAWSAANTRFDGYFRDMVTRFEYRDALLLDAQGNVVYSVNKGFDLGTNIVSGPYRESELHDGYEKALGANALNFAWITDFGRYQPDLGAPTAWMVAPVRSHGETYGVLAVPLPIAKINRVMTFDKDWQQLGLGATTETYLAGPDDLMRSDSRLFLEDPEEYRREAVAAGTASAVVDEAIRLGGTTLVQPVPGAALRAAQRGETGIITAEGYLGMREMQAYAPLTVPDSDLQWSILATKDNSEAFARAAWFTRRIVLTTAAIIFVVCLVSALAARAFVRPIRRLEVGANKISAGDYDVAIPETASGEIGDLAAAFNAMSRSLRIKEELLTEQREENNRLLRSLMPEAVMERYRQGDETIAAEHHDITAIYADIVGLDEVSTELSGDELVEKLNGLVRQFDSAAESLGVERVRTLHNGYLAACGVTTPRLDNVRRTVDFALEMQRIVDRFNGRTGDGVALRAGITTGTAVSGLVGLSSVAYDLWGPAVSLAYQMHSGMPQAGIYVSAGVYEVMGDTREFTPAGTIVVGGSEQQIWRLSERP